MEQAPDEKKSESLATGLFLSEMKSITGWMVLFWLVLTALGVAGLIQSCLDRDQSKFALSSLYSLFILALSIGFFFYLRRKRRWYLQVENERLREKGLPDDADSSEFICSVCHKYSPSGIISCDMCGRKACPDCLREEEGEDDSLARKYCPVCWDAGEGFRDRMIELEIAFDAKKERLEEEWKEAAVLLVGKGAPTGGELSRKMRGFDATFGEGFREKLVELDMELEREREALAATWREEALSRIQSKRPGLEPDESPKGQALDSED
jgi:hypothetical protein